MKIKLLGLVFILYCSGARADEFTGDLTLADQLYSKGDYTRAALAYERAIAAYPSAAAYNNLGNARLALFDYPMALACFKKAIGLDPEYAEPWYNLGNAVYDQHRFADAAGAYQKSIDISPGFEQAWYNLGNAFFKLELYSEARKSYARALELNPADYQAAYNFGNCCYDLHEYPEAIQAYKAAAQLNPHDPLPHKNMYELYLIINNRNSANSELEIVRKMSGLLAEELLRFKPGNTVRK
ncbi:MAG: tetratricopeptide repeat protein [Candidatus Wallbacteria bacterium]|nr:tetratricopeptide repeat protein [Candidatus Wallbacteria bacterium]